MRLERAALRDGLRAVQLFQVVAAPVAHRDAHPLRFVPQVPGRVIVDLHHAVIVERAIHLQGVVGARRVIRRARAQSLARLDAAEDVAVGLALVHHLLAKLAKHLHLYREGHGGEELEEIEGDALVVVRLVAEEPAEDRGRAPRAEIDRGGRRVAASLRLSGTDAKDEGGHD